VSERELKLGDLQAGYWANHLSPPDPTDDSKSRDEQFDDAFSLGMSRQALGLPRPENNHFGFDADMTISAQMGWDYALENPEGEA
jgi:hypothetical protein